VLVEGEPVLAKELVILGLPNSDRSALTVSSLNAYMTVTPSRILFGAGVGGRGFLKRALDFLTQPEEEDELRRSMPRSLESNLTVHLSDVTGFQTWQPRLSGPPLILLGTERFRGISFHLIDPRSREFIVEVGPQAIARHFELVEEAWRSAKSTRS